MLRRQFAPFAAFLLVVWSAPALWAQEIARPEGAPAHVSFVEGGATLEREGRIDEAPDNMPLLAGDRVRTREGRVEILFADGSTLHLDHNTTIDLQSDELVRLIGGRIRLAIPGPARDISYRVDTPFAWAQIAEAGEYRATLQQTNAGEPELEIAVLRGRAELVNEDGRTPLGAGERAFARANAAPSYAYVFNSASWDAFDRWSEARRSERLGLSTQYLPEEVRPYSASFDRYGSWRYESSYGYVWYPRVDVGWRPYYRGRWLTLRPYGVTWVSSDPWGWPTHHYGRWGFSAGTWFWIPGRTWGPAWVSWAYAPGYVSWCPLGWNNRPVVQFVNINVYRGYDPWRAWTVIPDRHFGRDYVHRRVVGGHSIDERTRRAFTERDRAPQITGYAVPRGSGGAAPIRAAGTRGIDRTATPLLTNRGGNGSTYRAPGRTAPDPRPADRATTGTEPRAGGDVRNRAMPTRPMVRSDRAPQAERPQPSITEPRRNELPIYQRPDGYRRDDGPALSEPRRGESNGYRARPETYQPSGRAAPRGEYGPPPAYGSTPNYGESRRPAVSEPRRGESNGRPAVSEPRRGESNGPPPSAGRPSEPRRGEPRGVERQGPPPAPRGPDRASPPPSRGGGDSRPRSGGAPSRGTAVARPGGRGGR